MDNIQDLVIFYFSGTGNARMIASWFSEFGTEKGISCKTTDIAQHGHFLENINSETAIGIISPIHGFNYPKITMDFIRHFPEGKNRVILMNTRGGLRIGKLVTPGLTGIAFMLSSLILRKKGYKIIGQIAFDMPSNWISIHPALRQKSIQIILEKNYFDVKKHFEKLYSGRNDFSSRKDIIQNMLISPVSVAYYFIGRYFLAKSYYASSKCTNCNLCIKQCPVKAIKKVDARPYWTFKCESCMKCMNNCPVNAIETTHGLWVLGIYISSIICASIFHYFAPDFAQNLPVKVLPFSIILIAVMAIIYRIQQVMLKNPIIAKLISLTSLTHFKFWGRYKPKKD